jgi:hypothetical protein
VTVLVLVVLAGEVNVEGFEFADAPDVAEKPELGGLAPRKLEKLRRPRASPPSLDNRDTTANKSSDPPLLACCCPCCLKPKLWFFFEKKDRMPRRKVLFFLPPGVVSSDCGVGMGGRGAPAAPVVERERRRGLGRGAKRRETPESRRKCCSRRRERWV